MVNVPRELFAIVQRSVFTSRSSARYDAKFACSTRARAVRPSSLRRPPTDDAADRSARSIPRIPAAAARQIVEEHGVPAREPFLEGTAQRAQKATRASAPMTIARRLGHRRQHRVGCRADQAGHTFGHHRGVETHVACEYLVAAVAGEYHGHVFARQLRHQIYVGTADESPNGPS